MDSRNCGECEECAKGNYGACSIRAEYRLRAAAPELRKALEAIAGMAQRAHDSVGMVDNPFPRALNAASKIAADALATLK